MVSSPRRRRLRQHVTQDGVQRGECAVSGRGEPVAGLPHERDRSRCRVVHRVAPRDGGARGAGGLAQVVRGGQAARLLGQLPVLAGLRIDGLDLGEPVPQEVRLLREPSRPVPPLAELGRDRLPLGAHRPVSLQRNAHGVAGEAIQ